MMMRVLPVLMLGLIALGACGSEADKAAPTAGEQVQASAAEPSDAAKTEPVVLTADQLRSVCQTALSNIHGQRVDVIQIDGIDGETVRASWPAPVDGGRLIFTCAVNGADVTLTRDGQTQTHILTSSASAAQGEAR